MTKNQAPEIKEFTAEAKTLKKVWADLEQEDTDYTFSECATEGFNRMQTENMTLYIAAQEKPSQLSIRERLADWLSKPLDEKLVSGHAQGKVSLKHEEIENFIESMAANTPFSKSFVAGFLITYGYRNLVGSNEMSDSDMNKLRDDYEWKLTTMKKVFGAGYGGEVDNLSNMDTSEPSSKSEQVE